MISGRTLFIIVFPLIWGAAILSLAFVAIDARPILPGDELRDLSVAWDMWRKGSYLVPHINGEPSADVFPLLSWVITAGWALFGVNDVWPRAVSPLFGFASIFMCAMLARIIWPGLAGIGALSGTVLMGSVIWLVQSMLPGATMIGVFALLVAIWGVLFSWRTGQWSGCLLAGMFIGLGLLAVGPVLLLYCLPLMMTAPIWGRVMLNQQTGDDDPAGFEMAYWRYWYMQMLATLSVAIMIGLAWMVPAILQQDSIYVSALIERLFVLGSLDQGPGWWGRALMLSGLFLPWIFWPPAWRTLLEFFRMIKDGGVWLCLFWMMPVLLYFALSEQVGFDMLAYLLPAMALILGYLLFVRGEAEVYRLTRHTTADSANHQVRGRVKALFSKGESFTGFVVAIIGVCLLVVPLAAETFDLSWWIGRLSGGWGLIIMLSGGLIAMTMPPMLGVRALVLSVVSVVIVASGFLASHPLRDDESGLMEAANRIAQHQAEGKSIAFVGPYNGMFDFTGRLEVPLDILDRDDPVGVVAWVAGGADANGAEVVTIHAMLPANIAPVAVFPWWGNYIVFWSADAVESHPGLIFQQKQP